MKIKRVFSSRWFTIIITCALVVAPATVEAACGSKNLPSYDDVDAIMLKQTGCGSTLEAKGIVTTLDCSSFWTLIWGSTNTSTYSQYNLSGFVGSYQLAATIQEVRDILKRDDFYSLSPADRGPTDMTYSVLTVKRCAVVTRIRLYNAPMFEEPATERVFADLRRLIDQSVKKRISDIPEKFKATLLFDP